MGMKRRDLLCRSAALGLAPLGLLQGCDEFFVPCYDPDALGVGERELRAELAYVNVSEDEARTCEGCQFYYLGGENCGECQLLDGPVTRGGYCTSWAVKV